MPQGKIPPNSQQRSVPYLLWSALIRKQPINDRLCIQTTPTVAAHEWVRVRPLVVSTNHDAQLWEQGRGRRGGSSRFCVTALGSVVHQREEIRRRGLTLPSHGNLRNIFLVMLMSLLRLKVWNTGILKCNNKLYFTYTNILIGYVI